MKRNKIQFKEVYEKYLTGDLRLTVSLCNKALAKEPKNSQYLLLVGIALLQLGKTDKALNRLKKAVKIEPKNPYIHLNMGSAFNQKNMYRSAVNCYLHAIAIDPGISDAFSNLCQSYKALNEFSQAEVAVREALRLDPGNLRLMETLAVLMQYQGNFHEAIGMFGDIYAKDPENYDVAYKLSLAQLAIGKYSPEVLELYEQRWKVASFNCIQKWDDTKRWDGLDQSCEELCLWSEQGLGDHILFSSVLPWLNERFLNIVAECDKRLISIFKRSFPNIRFIASDGVQHKLRKYKKSGKHSPFGSAYLVQKSYEIPDVLPEGHLQADPSKKKEYEQFLKTTGPRSVKIGISWKSKRNDIGALKSIPLSQMGAIFKLPHVQFINLQYGYEKQEIQEVKDKFGVNIVTHPTIDLFNDIDDLFALVSGLDLIITSSNVTAHISGSLGIPTIIALPKSPVWYWGANIDTASPYSSVDRVWQSSYDRWDDVLNQVSEKLISYDLLKK